MEEFGRGLVVEPYLSSVILSGDLTREPETSGSSRSCLARSRQAPCCWPSHMEKNRRDTRLPTSQTVAQRRASGFLLSGHKSGCSTAKRPTG